MGLGMWYREEILNALVAAQEVCHSTVAALGNDSEYARGYEDGFMVALFTLARAFGIHPRASRSIKVKVYQVETPPEQLGHR